MEFSDGHNFQTVLVKMTALFLQAAQCSSDSLMYHSIMNRLFDLCCNDGDVMSRVMTVKITCIDFAFVEEHRGLAQNTTGPFRAYGRG